MARSSTVQFGNIITAQSPFCKIYFLGLLDVLHILYSVKSNDGHAASVVILVFEH